MTEHFDKYINLIRKSAHHYSNIFNNIEYEEIEAQGFLIYCECVDKYDITKASFSTYLVSELRRLGDYCESVYKHDRYGAYSIDNEEITTDFAYSELPTLQNLLEDARNSLSEMGYRVFEWILKRSWEKKGRAKPTIKNVCDAFSISVSVATKVWYEIGDFYRKGLVL